MAARLCIETDLLKLTQKHKSILTVPTRFQCTTTAECPSPKNIIGNPAASEHESPKSPDWVVPGHRQLYAPVLALTIGRTTSRRWEEEEKILEKEIYVRKRANISDWK